MDVIDDSGNVHRMTTTTEGFTVLVERLTDLAAVPPDVMPPDVVVKSVRVTSPLKSIPEVAEDPAWPHRMVEVFVSMVVSAGQVPFGPNMSINGTDGVFGSRARWEMVKRMADCAWNEWEANFSPRRWGLWNTDQKCWVSEDDGHFGTRAPKRFRSSDEAATFAEGRDHLVPKEFTAT
jgi:hypothetical protein